MENQKKYKFLATNLDAFNLYIDFFSTLNSELRSWLWWAAVNVVWSTQSAVLNRDILRPHKSDRKIKNSVTPKQRQKLFKEKESILKFEIKEPINIHKILNPTDKFILYYMIK